MLEAGQVSQEPGTQPGEILGEGQMCRPKAQGAMYIQGASSTTAPI